MAKYFDLFPKLLYDIDGKRLSKYSSVTDVFFRLRVIRQVLGNASAYYEYIVSDFETPEILADKVYGDPEAHWIILLANDILDPQYDWPLNYNQFKNYIIKKYGSIENAQTNIHHYEKVVTRFEELKGIVDETRFVVNKEKLTVNDMTVPYDYYQGTGSLPETQELTTYNLETGATLIEIISRNDVSFYDYEDQMNENKRTIKIIKPEYYGQIIREFNELTEFAATPYLRRLL